MIIILTTTDGRIVRVSTKRAIPIVTNNPSTCNLMVYDGKGKSAIVEINRSYNAVKKLIGR